MSKTCSKCGEDKDVSEFHKCVQNKSGYRPQCKLCRNTSERSYYAASSDSRLKSCKEYYERDLKRNQTKRRAYQHANKYKPEVVAYRRTYYQENKEAYRARDAKRRAAKLKRTPVWVDHAAIKAFYAACPPGRVVDHKIPLQGKTVSGLHVLKNLQYLTPAENSKKSNRYPYE